MLNGQPQGNNTTNESQKAEDAGLHSNSAAPKEASVENSDKTLPSPTPARPLAQPASAAINRVPKNAWLYLFTFLNYHDVYRGVGFVSKEWRRFSEDSIIENALYHHWQTKCREHPEFQDTTSLTHFLLPDKEVDEKELKVDRYFAQRLDNPIPIDMDMSIGVLIETFQAIKDVIIPNWTQWPGHIHLVQQQFYSTITAQQLRERLENLFTETQCLRQEYQPHLKELASLPNTALTPAFELTTEALLVLIAQPLPEQPTNTNLPAGTNVTEAKQTKEKTLSLQGYVKLYKFFTEARDVIQILNDVLIIGKMAGLLTNQNGLNPAGLPHVLQMLQEPDWTSYMTGKAIIVMASFRLFFLGEFFKDDILAKLLGKLTLTEMLFVSRYNSSPDDSIQLATLASLIALPFVRPNFTEQEFIRFAHYSYDEQTTISGKRATVLLSNENVTDSLSDESLIALMCETSIQDVSRPDMDQWAEIKEILVKNPNLKDHMAEKGGELWLKLAMSSVHYHKFIVQAPEVHEGIPATKLANIIFKITPNIQVYFSQPNTIDKFQGVLTNDQLETVTRRCTKPEVAREVRRLISKENYQPAPVAKPPLSFFQRRRQQGLNPYPRAAVNVQPSPALTTPASETLPSPNQMVETQKSSAWTWGKILAVIGIVCLLLISLALIACGSTALAGVEFLFITKAAAGYVLGSGCGGLVLTGILGWFGFGPSHSKASSAREPTDETTITPPSSYSSESSRTSSTSPQPEYSGILTTTGEHYALSSSSSLSSSATSGALTSPAPSVPLQSNSENLGHVAKVPTLSQTRVF